MATCFLPVSDTRGYLNGSGMQSTYIFHQCLKNDVPHTTFLRRAIPCKIFHQIFVILSSKWHPDAKAMSSHAHKLVTQPTGYEETWLPFNEKLSLVLILTSKPENCAVFHRSRRRRVGRGRGHRWIM